MHSACSENYRLVGSRRVNSGCEPLRWPFPLSLLLGCALASSPPGLHWHVRGVSARNHSRSSRGARWAVMRIRGPTVFATRPSRERFN